MFRAKVLFHFVFLKVVAFLPTEILLLLVGTNSGNENLKYFIICEWIQKWLILSVAVTSYVK
jgi:hypothetical protein